MTIMLMQYTGLISGNSEQMEEQLRRAIAQQNNQPGTSMHVVDTQERSSADKLSQSPLARATIKLLPCGNGQLFLKATKDRRSLMVQGVAERWDQQLLDDFIKSIN